MGDARNALRFVGRSVGFYGSDEIARSDQEIRGATAAIKDGGKLLIESSEARGVAWGVTKDVAGTYWEDELNRYHLFGRMIFGFSTGFSPVANIGDATRALENGHSTFDSMVKGITGDRTK